MAEKQRKQKLESLYRDYKDYVFNYLYRMTGDHDQSMDVTQITFTKAFQDPELMHIRHIKAYLLTIARHALYDEWRRKKELTQSPDEAAANEPMDDPQARPLEQLSQADLQDKVEAAIAAMPPNYRELMILRYTEDLPVKEIAQITGRSESDVKVSLHRGRLRFERDFENRMYSRVAKSRDRCEELNHLLTPYETTDIPADALKLIDKHLKTCSICEEDKKALRQSRELFTALPLIPAPLALDERMTAVLQSGGTTGLGEPAVSAANDPGIGAGTLMQTTAAKWAAGIATAALLGGAGTMLLQKDKQDPVIPSNQAVTASGPGTTQQAALGKVSLKAVSGKHGQALDEGITWKVTHMNGKTPTLIKQTSLATPSLELPAGVYQLELRQGRYVKKTLELVVSEGQDQQQNIVLESARLGLSAGHAKTGQGIEKVRWVVYENAQKTGEARRRIASEYGTEVSLLLPPGAYTVEAYHENAKVKRDIELSDGQAVEMPEFAFTVGELQLAARVTPNSPVQEGVQWRVYEQRANGKEQHVEAKYGGRVSFTLPAGSYRVLARHENSEVITYLDLDSGETLNREDIILGSGTLRLAARLSPDSPVQKGVQWQVYTVDDQDKKTNIESRYADTVVFDLPEGHYHILATYKKARAHTEVDIKAGKETTPDDLIFNAGIVTLSARLSPDSPIQKGVRWQVYTLDEQGKKSTLGSRNGDTVSFTLPAGEYRVQASFGKAKKVTGARVVAGAETVVDEVILDAGRLLLATDQEQRAVRWQVYQEQADGRKKIFANKYGKNAEFVLPSGVYQVSAGQGQDVSIKELTIVSGKDLKEVF